MKLLGKWVRLPDGREGHIAGATIDGYTVVIDGRIVTAKDVTPIAPPAATEHPEPIRTQAPIVTHHPLDEELPAQVIANPLNMAVLVDGKWSLPQ
jgi:hypothetical protein